MENETPRQCVIPIHEPNRRELIFFFASGILVSIPFAAFFESFVPVGGFSAVLLLVVFAPPIEELSKVFPLFYRHGETERSIVTLGLLIGLGFGTAEFFEYIFLAGAPVIGSIPHLIFHASSATITSYGIAKKNPIPYYILAVSLHMTSNLFVFATDVIGVFAQLLVLIAVYLLAVHFYRKSSKEKMVA